MAVTLSGTRLSGLRAEPASTLYGPLAVDVAPGGVSLRAEGLAPGVWLHRISVDANGQHQARRSLVVADAEHANPVDWTLYASVLEVTRDGDDGDGVCDGACTLREAIDAAPWRRGPALVHFDHAAFAGAQAVVELSRGALVVRAPALTLDGTDAGGNPSPLAHFAQRSFNTLVSVRAPNAAPNPDLACPCNESGAALRIAAADVRVIGVAFQRQLAPEGTICCGDQDLVAFDAGSRGSHLETARLDGGAAAIRSAEVPSGTTAPPTGKDCIDASGTGADDSDSAVVVENSEIRFCHDRGAKSQGGWLRLRRNWIHHNLRGGLFAQSPASGSAAGVIDASDNLIEQNGIDCPSGNAAACGPDQVVTRGGASEISAQGPLTAIVSVGNVVRDGAAQGLYFEDGSSGRVIDTYVCGINRSSGGKGILSQRSSGTAADLVVRGTTVAYNDDAGFKLRGRTGADLGTLAEPGLNAFTDNGAGTRRNLLNALDAPPPVVAAMGNGWEHCYGSRASMDACDEAAISDVDTNNALGGNDRVDVRGSLAHQGSGPMRIDAVSPAAVGEGDLLRLTGAGFDAISGHDGGVGGDCSGLAAGNSCAPLHGTCVEFLVDGSWRPALDVVGVTPTSVTVRAPFDCTAPTLLRARRLDRTGAEVAADPVPFCVAGGR